jgi:membrane protease YdiL (CAAX protease family)
MLLVVVILLIAGTLAAGTDLATFDVEVRFDLTDPLLLAVLLGSIALMLPAYLLASLIVNGPRVGLISSAAGRTRWGWMLVSLAAATVVAGVVTGVSALLPAELEGSTGEIISPAENPQFWVTLAVVLLVIPFQAAAEEYVFRGYLQQAIGRWLKHPAFAILLPVPLFVLGHAYDPLGQASVAIFAIAAGWMTWRTGGLEAAIALHIVNNLLAFLLGLAGLADVNDSSPGLISFFVSFVMIAAYVGVIEWLFRRSGHHRTLRLTTG